MAARRARRWRRSMRLEKSGTPASELAGLRAAALHALRDHATELKVLLGAREASSVLDRRTLSGVAEDLAREGGEGPRSDFLDGLDAGRSTAVLRAIAESGDGEAAWGALQLPRATAPDGDAGSDGRSTASWLDGTDCAARVVAARRLGELGRPEAVAALQKARRRSGRDRAAARTRSSRRFRPSSGTEEAPDMALEMRPVCERCGAALTPDGPARICSLRMHVLRRLHRGDEGRLPELRR